MWPHGFIRSDLSEALAGWPPPVLDPAGPFARPIATLSWVVFAMGGVVLFIVIVALGVALFGGEKTKARLGGEKAIWIGGFAFPVVVLSALLVWGLSLTHHLSAPAGEGEMHVRVTGEMWWWRVEYPGAPAFTDANELHIPTGQPVLVELHSADVVHSFWVPRLSGKVDMVPGRINHVRLQADEPGVYGGQCAEYCGGPHALMGFVVVAHTPEDFARWRASRRPNPLPDDPLARRGAELFNASGCGACHMVRGTPANGLAGPDLTHIGSRRSLGAGILPNNRGTLAGWVAGNQSIKPGNRMPDYRMFSGDELQAIAAYLDQLQ